MAYPRSLGIAVLAYVDVAWYENLPPTSGCFDKVQWLSATEPFTWEWWSRVLAIAISFYFAATCCRKPMRRDAVEDTTVPRHPVRFEHHLVPGPSRQAPYVHAFIPRQTSRVV